ncbi:acyl-coenzyme A synthetase/AMP-(fatty) acid ligase/thioester reductase-like protein [Sulfitobacter undariae]|uniref:Acyl-coenzyme A synthetase/AMP-(Fatty) acid ligase/thioester reductase-like protein n=1 Tax=Sulfitobacter undariae TaxID=1563671 RepID=A0A7W6ECK4_9RHOB|nr:AMP-binding protein [Sulfitobacter undariae]MBB3995698.1 acyl-coenzyme A synthetase/AMP-(fatty) acid ligase/thioester reductase-like protein [Sulfitobacter undariae]
MTEFLDIPSQIAQALQYHSDKPALADRAAALSYGQLADFISKLQPLMPSDAPVAVFGKPSLAFGAAVTACIVSGRPFVHLDPAMPNEVLGNILEELAINTVFLAEPPTAGQLPQSCTRIEVAAQLDDLSPTPPRPVIAPKVAADDIIYIVATSGTTGKPKCIPVTQISAALSYAWRDTYTPYGPDDRVGAYIFAIWEMFRPLRNGASVHFAQFNELMSPTALVRFWQRTGVTEMLFTPSALEKSLLALPNTALPDLSLQRIILNGEVVSDDLIAAVRHKLPDVTLLNLYSICETHDICITDVTAREAQSGPVSVGVPMAHLRAVVLDDNDQPCPAGQPGLLHFEGPDMLGPGYINRPEETALRFRTLKLDGRDARLYDTGDQGYVDRNSAVFVIGRIAHMLKLRGHSIQTRELTESLHDYIGFQQGVPWIKPIAGQDNALVLYYTCDADQAAQNAKNWGLDKTQMRIPAALSKALRKDLPAYCIPSYLIRLDDIPINAVSGKYDYKRLPDIDVQDAQVDDGTALPTLAQAAKVMGCDVDALDLGLSFGDQGGDSLMAVTFLLSLEEIYNCPVDFDFALNVPLGRLHDLLSEATRDSVQAEFTRTGILLTGATGFLGSSVLKAAAAALPEDQVIYCVIREKRNASADRLQRIAATHGVDPDRLVLISASLEDTRFGLDQQSYLQLAACVRSVIHCAAMVNLAVDRSHSQKWSQTGISNILAFCAEAQADLRYTSSTAVFPDAGGPFPEAATKVFEGCSGYGAAKIDAEAQIIASGVPAAIFRLPSLYDLAAPNPHDIYEIIMTACNHLQAVPEGITFRMVDVHKVAAVLVGMTPVNVGAQYYNYGSDIFVTPVLIPDHFTVCAPQDWLRDAPLSDAQRALIASDMLVLRATSRFEHTNAKAAWGQVMDGDFATAADPAALVQARFTNSSPR